MNANRRLIRLTALLATGALVLAACSGSGTSPSASAPGSASVAPWSASAASHSRSDSLHNGV